VKCEVLTEDRTWNRHLGYFKYQKLKHGIWRPAVNSSEAAYRLIKHLKKI